MLLQSKGATACICDTEHTWRGK